MGDKSPKTYRLRTHRCGEQTPHRRCGAPPASSNGHWVHFSIRKKKKKHGKTSRFTTSRMSKKLHLLHQLCTNPQPPKNAEGGSLPWNELRNLGRSTTPHGSARDIPPHGTSAALGSAWGNHLVLIYIHPQYCWTPKPPAPV